MPHSPDLDRFELTERHRTSPIRLILALTPVILGLAFMTVGITWLVTR